MDPQQYLALTESIQLCNQLLNEMEADKDRIAACVSGSLRTAYLEANDQATQEIKKLRTLLQQPMQG